MKKILTLLCVSALGGALTLGAYKHLFENSSIPKPIENQATATLFPVSLNAPLSGGTNVDFTTAADKTVHSVVHVKNTTLNKSYTSFEDLFFGRPQQYEQIGTGSGVIISPDGYVITNNHVIEGAQSIEITTNDNKTFDAKLIGTDPNTDIALLKIEADEPLKYTTFGDSNSARIGEWVLAVGNPFNLTSTVTAGIISAKSRDLSGQNTQSFIQTDAAVNPGNSGGALVNINGELIGINTAISSQTGSYIGYSFAVPSNIARKVVEDIMEYGNVQNVILGIYPIELNSHEARNLDIDETEGIYIESVEEDSGAQAAGLKKGDIIKNVDGIKISKFSDLKGVLNSKSLNDIVEISYIRNGNLKTIPVNLLKNQTYVLPFIGKIKNANPENLRKYKTSNGVKISNLNRKYMDYWKKNGVTEGNIITAINDVNVNSIADVKNILKNQTSLFLKIELINSYGEKERFNFR